MEPDIPADALITVSYEPTAEDSFLPFWRHYQSMPLYQRNFWIGVVGVAIIGAGIGYGATYLVQVHILPLADISIAWPYWPAVVGVSQSVYTIYLYISGREKSVRQRMKKFYEKNMPGNIKENRVTYCIRENMLEQHSGGSRTRIDLADLRSVVELEAYLEIHFADKALCMIPLRAFASDADRTRFVDLLHRCTSDPPTFGLGSERPTQRAKIGRD